MLIIMNKNTIITNIKNFLVSSSEDEKDEVLNHITNFSFERDYRKEVDEEFPDPVRPPRSIIPHSELRDYKKEVEDEFLTPIRPNIISLAELKRLSQYEGKFPPRIPIVGNINQPVLESNLDVLHREGKLFVEKKYPKETPLSKE